MYYMFGVKQISYFVYGVWGDLLNHSGLLTSYGDMDAGQHWFR